MSVAFSVDAGGVGWIVFAAPGSRANVFDAGMLEALSAALDAADASEARALVLASAKERIFIAGADLRWLQALPDAAAAETFSRRGQLLFERLAGHRLPVVCALHGACAGGGYELALATDWRVATDDPVTRIGLPETSLGTIPGWGGCVRLPRLIGAERALEHILRGELRTASAAWRDGLVDELVPSADLRDRARAAALKLAGSPPDRRRVPPAAAPAFFARLRAQTFARTGGHEPARVAAIDAVAACAGKPVAEALPIEAHFFGEVTAGEVCRNLIHVFFLREAAKKRALGGWRRDRPGGTELRPIRQVGVVGAGVMGSGIAHWLARRGFDVVLRDVQGDLVERARAVIQGLLEEGVTRGKGSADEARRVLRRIRTTTGWDGFGDCDAVIEAIVEDVATKRALFSEMAGVAAPDALLASNSSALPVEDIAGHLPHAERTLGIHFFNPVSRMPLVELVLGRNTSAAAADRALGLVHALGKSPVICRSSPGFFVTRVLFFYLNAAVRLWEEGVDAAAADPALRRFGWPMGPLRLIDEVGVDVTASIFREMAHYFPDRFAPTKTCDRMLAAGLQGRKNGAGRGFYTYAGGREELNENEVRSLSAGDRRTPAARPPPGDEIVAGLMRVMLEEARRCLAERVVASAEEADFALLGGAGFPAFRGGLLRWAGRGLEPSPGRTTGGRDL